MPTVLFLNGWRFHFYSDERNEPPHIHAVKGERECKFWLDAERFEIREAFAYNLSPRDRREARQIIFEHFDHLVAEWNRIHGEAR